MRKINLFGVAAALILTGVGGWIASTPRASVAAPIGSKNLPTQEELNLKMWPDNGVVRY